MSYAIAGLSPCPPGSAQAGDGSCQPLETPPPLFVEGDVEGWHEKLIFAVFPIAGAFAGVAVGSANHRAVSAAAGAVAGAGLAVILSMGVFFVNEAIGASFARQAVEGPS